MRIQDERALGKFIAFALHPSGISPIQKFDVVSIQVVHDRNPGLFIVHEIDPPADVVRKVDAGAVLDDHRLEETKANGTDLKDDVPGNHADRLPVLHAAHPSARPTFAL
jgi:hypothetical protein